MGVRKIILTKSEKQLVRAMIAYSKEKGLEMTARQIELDFMNFTGMSNMAHRDLVEAYAKTMV